MKGYSQMICEIANHVNYLDLKFSDSLMFRKMVLVLIMPQYMAILIILTVKAILQKYWKWQKTPK